ncbi:MAG: N-acetyl-gamma-glutamyl-phosphate reductase [Actinomycetota bacterium]|nr:N-acetyl-gamma-glutamyl-phosphate reductase [Actinomycetota bacterium]
MGYRVVIAGASGYAGGELLRLVSAHPDLDVLAVTAHGNVGEPVGAVHPGLRSVADLVFTQTTPEACADADLVFLALPHGASGSFAAALSPDQRVVDLGADHRLIDPAVYEQYYGAPHFGVWTYGLPELPGQRAEIADAHRIANTGCYAVATILALAPLVAAGIADPSDVVVVAASGTSGAGRTAKISLIGTEVMSDVSAYRVGAHQHVPEILQATGAHDLSMTPLLAPMPRGILAAVTMRPARSVSAGDVRAALASAYADEPFVHLLPEGVQPHTSATIATNAAHLQVAMDVSSGRIIVTSAIDNLGKGAAGQAVQNANIMLGLRETVGLAIDAVAS